MNSFSARIAGEVLLGLVVEVVELALEDRDDVARDVLADLRVLERALLAPPVVVDGSIPQKYQIPIGIRLFEDVTRGV